MGRVEADEGLPNGLRAAREIAVTRFLIDFFPAYHAAMPLREIRRWQDLVNQQIGMAWQQRNDFALANLRVREEILRRAADRKLPPLEASHPPRSRRPRLAVVS